VTVGPLNFQKMAKQVVITVPVYRCPLTDNEKISLRQLLHYLGDHDLTVIAPRSLDISEPLLKSMPVIRFDDDYFSGIPGYNRLMLSCGFYDTFKAYEYILIYQLDCLVFSKDLMSWCRKGWDYVGAPWFKDHNADTSEGFLAVGNGGLSLRRVSAFRKVLRSRRLAESPIEVGRETNYFPTSPGLKRLVKILKTVLSACGYRNTMSYFATQFPNYEDIFWSFYAKRALPGFKIPTPEEAVQFAFEMAPRYCFEKNGRQLPFGCHGWYKTDPKFWREVLAARSEPPESVPAAREKQPAT
jgi:hypothetical protein